MKIQLTRLEPRRRRHRPNGSSSVDKAHVRGFVEGYQVTAREGKGWSCSCLDDDCPHPDALAAVLHPEALAMLEGDAS